MKRNPKLQGSIDYLASQAALDAIALDPYWPKWDSPWWHITLLWEMGEASRIPVRALMSLVDALNRVDRVLEALCHCQLGTIYQILHAAGQDAESALPWVRLWLLNYQLSDGGLTCDYEEYARPSRPPASSMVGTLPALEAILYCTDRELTPEEKAFLDRGAKFMIARGLMRGSHAEEREDEADWLKPCFPRYYLYDVLRGLSWLLQWSELLQRPLPLAAIRPVMESLATRFPDGRVRKERLSTQDIATRIVNPDGSCLRAQVASRFALLDEVSRVGEESPWLSEEWEQARSRAARLGSSGLLV